MHNCFFYVYVGEGSERFIAYTRLVKVMNFNLTFKMVSRVSCCSMFYMCVCACVCSICVLLVGV